MTAVHCSTLWKSYRHGTGMGIKELLVGKNRNLGRFVREWALRDVTFEVEKGKSLGIVGANGSGKSTLLSLILGVIRADRGDIRVNGRISALLELGAGFHPELTGRENIVLYGAILGMTLAEIKSQFNAIVDFSELGAAVEYPLRTYSSGMITRLGFSTIIHTPADILLIDEVLAVGDAAFQRKCREFLKRFKGRGGTLIIVSHDMNALISLCDVGLCLSEGCVIRSGLIADVVSFYSAEGRKMEANQPEAETEDIAFQ